MQDLGGAEDEHVREEALIGKLGTYHPSYAAIGELTSWLPRTLWRVLRRAIDENEGSMLWLWQSSL